MVDSMEGGKRKPDRKVADEKGVDRFGREIVAPSEQASRGIFSRNVARQEGKKIWTKKPNLDQYDGAPSDDE